MLKMKNLFKNDREHRKVIQPQLNLLPFTFFYFNYKLMPIMINEVFQNFQMSFKS